MANPIGDLQRTWRHTPRAVRTGSEVSWVLASALAATGVALDKADWWNHHPFLLNLASSLTAFLAGAPIAIIALGALNEITTRHRHAREEHEAIRLRTIDLIEYLTVWQASDRSAFSPHWMKRMEGFITVDLPAYLRNDVRSRRDFEPDALAAAGADCRSKLDAYRADPNLANFIELAIACLAAARSLESETWFEKI